jgi:predicted nucleic acid-binding protein
VTLVLDGSAALALLLPDEREAPAARTIRAEFNRANRVLAPLHWFAEVANGIVVAERRKRIFPTEADKLLTALRRLGVAGDVVPPEDAVAAACLLARQHGLTAYDAAYLELALRENAVLATQDNALRRAANASAVPLVPA